MGPDLTVTIFERPDRKPGGPAMYYIHGGGMIIGDRWFGTGTIIDWVDDLDAILVTVEYRLAPEHPYPPQSTTATPACCGWPPTMPNSGSTPTSS